MSLSKAYNHNGSFLKIDHGLSKTAGFFSNCSERLQDIINYLHYNYKLPYHIDDSSLFYMYKTDKSKSIVYDFFQFYRILSPKLIKRLDEVINIHSLQFTTYKTIDYFNINPYVTKYFSPSPKIIENVHYLLNEYSINPDNTIGIYYRGTDKCKETKLGGYKKYYDKLLEIQNINCDNELKILIQSDQAQFINYIKEKIDNKYLIIISDNSVTYKNVGIHFQKNSHDNYKDIMYLLPTFLILSKCKYLLTSSCNCGMWMALFRKSSNNLHQYLENNWV